MKLDATETALVRIAARREEAVAERQRLAQDDRYPLGYQHEAGIVAGLSIALDLLREAGLPVAFAEYLAKPTS